MFRTGLTFDLIWLSAVWMHVPSTSRQRAFRKMVTLLRPGGRIMMSLRQGPPPDDLWNLFPVHPGVNHEKGDRLPGAEALVGNVAPA